jgi:DNA-directed RNA polymerase specialized sigma24 family protein
LVYFAALRRMCGDAQGAGDVTQHVFIAAVRHARHLARHPGIVGWLYLTTRNAALDHMRNEQRRRQREHEANVANENLREGSPPSFASNAPEATGEWEELRPVLDGAIG